VSLPLYLSQIAAVLGCDAPTVDVAITGSAIDSRKVFLGSLFVAIVGERVDGHDYIAAARKAGASAALVSVKQHDPLPQLVVADVVKAFAALATFWRQQSNAKIVAVTGSNGKTSVKEMIAAILRQCGNVIATQGNLNNDLGVPLTLTRLTASTDYAVIEMGASRRGDILRLVEMAQPQFSLINNVGPAHLEGFGDVMGVAKAKAEIYYGLTDDGVGVINADMDYVDAWKEVLANRKSLSFALDNEADITAKDLQMDTSSSHFMVELADEFHYINVPLPGRHNVANALAAIAITHAMGIPAEAMVKGLATMAAVPHRLQLRKGLNQSQLIDDSYNANPASYKQALATLASFSGQHWLVLGDFGELGAESEHLHSQMGADAKNAGIQRLWTVGVQSKNAGETFGAGAQHFDNIAALEAMLKQDITQDVTCLIKGSRFMQLDKLADSLAQEDKA
jgi:UDP-N-acetylmuramoyl-tripeptide--D-alanyl-D-alanine ligase